MRKVSSILTINRRCIKKLKLGQKCSFICEGRFSVFMFLIQSEPRKRTIQLCLHYHTHGGKKQCSYCVIGRHKSWGCEPANPVTHHNGCYVWQRNFQKRAWDLWQTGGYPYIWLTNRSLCRDTQLFICVQILIGIEKKSILQLLEAGLTKHIQRVTKSGWPVSYSLRALNL